MDFLLGFATATLEKHGEFFPHAAAMGADGEITAVAVDPGTDQPDPTELLNLLEAALKDRATDAVQASLDHAQADAVDVFLPYSKKRFGAYDFGEVFAAPGTRQVFG